MNAQDIIKIIDAIGQYGALWLLIYLFIRQKT